MYSKRKQKQRNIRRWDYLWVDSQDDKVRGGIWKKRRLCTSYVNEEQNWLYSNYSYFKEIDSYYESRWNEYYSGCL